MTITRFALFLAVSAVVAARMVAQQKKSATPAKAPADQWPNYQTNSIFLNVTNAGNYHASGTPIARAFGEGNNPANADSPAAARGQGQQRGARYVVIPAGGGGSAARGQQISDALVAFRLPK